MPNLNSVIDFLARVWPQTVVIVGTAVLAVMLIIARRRHPRTSDPRTAARRKQAQLSAERIEEIKPPTDRWSGFDSAVDEQVNRSQPASGDLDDKLQRLEDLVQQADERIAALRELVAANSGGPTSKSSEPLDPLTRSVYELNDAGRRPVEIAQALDEQVGKVELILALRQ